MQDIINIENNNLIQQAEQRLQILLERLPKPYQFTTTSSQMYTLEYNKYTYTLKLEVLTSAQPRFVRIAISKIRESNAIGIIVAPWISDTSKQLLEAAGCWYLDLQGNARIVFDGILIERLGAVAPKEERRELRSLWKPISARVLRTLLRFPTREWNLLQLSQAAIVSHAQVHKVKTALLAQEWLEEQGKARFKTLRLTNPKALLEAWKVAYQPTGRRSTWYTMLERNEIEQILIRLEQPQIVLAGYSAARYLAPFARHPNEFLYATRAGLKELQKHLDLQDVDRGENIIVYLEPDEGIFLDSLEQQGLYLTSPIQTYLDLSHMGSRGLEAAEHLLETRIRPTWEGL